MKIYTTKCDTLKFAQICKKENLHKYAAWIKFCTNMQQDGNLQKYAARIEICTTVQPELILRQISRYKIHVFANFDFF